MRMLTPPHMVAEQMSKLNLRVKITAQLLL